MQNSRKIDCKINFNNEIRRISFTGAEFSSLKQEIQNLFEIKSEFVLKYLDNESDLILLTSNEEFKLALDYSDKILRLTVECVSESSLISDESSEPMTVETEVESAEHHYGGRHCGGRGHHGGKHRGGRGRGKHCDRGNHSDRWEGKKVHLLMKIDMLKGFVAQFPEDSQLTARDLTRKERLLGKIKHLEEHLNQWEQRKNMKNEKHENRLKLKSEKSRKPKKNFSPETAEKIRVLKEQIKQLKTVKKQMKSEIQQKKQALESLENTPNLSSQWEEIQDLKDKMAAIRQEIKPLKEKVLQIKAESNSL
jgi:DNA repair exonuclease SbcCD ATPase subunit